MSAPNLDTFSQRLDSAIPGLPANATIESVNYQQTTTVFGEVISFAGSVLVIYSTPLDFDFKIAF